MPGAKFFKNASADGGVVPIDMSRPQRLPYRPLILSPNVQQGQQGLAAESLAMEDSGEDCGPVDHSGSTCTPLPLTVRGRRL